MMITFDNRRYAELLVEYQPKAIDSDEENQRAIDIATKLEHQSERTLEEEEFLKLLLTLISQFEAERYPIPQSSKLSMLVHLMEAREITSVDLVPVLGSRSVVEAILAGAEDITSARSQAIANFFGVDSGLFDRAN
jgi:HTH-type transcriptional regulator / antitoxin HigA